MLTHGEIWTAIDRLAQANGLTTSGLARRAGLDPTTFNRSKRVTREGKERWPSTESIAKILVATGTTLPRFVALTQVELAQAEIDATAPGPRTLPLANLASLRSGGYLDPAGQPAGAGWDALPLPDIADHNSFAIEVTGHELEPVYRDGDILIVSSAGAPRRGDPVLVQTTAGDILIRRLLRRTASRLDLKPLTGNTQPTTLPISQVTSLSRIIWASQ